MIKLKANPTFQHDVELTIPGQKPTTVTFEFRHKNRAALDEYRKRAQDGEKSGTLLEQVIVDWGKAIIGDDGQSLPYKPDTLAALLEEYPGIALQIYTGYFEGAVGARAKN